MKKVMLVLMAMMSMGLTAQAEAGIITVIGRIRVAKANSPCENHAFQYFVTGDYRTPSGDIANIGACLGAVSIPLPVYLSEHIYPSNNETLSTPVNRVMDAEVVLAKNTNRLMKMRFLVENPEKLDHLDVLLSLEELDQPK